MTAVGNAQYRIGVTIQKKKITQAKTLICAHHYKANQKSGMPIIIGTYGSDQGAPNPRDHSPIEGNETHTQASVVAEELIDNNVVRCDPANPVEDAEGSEQISREPVPYEGANEAVKEETFTANVATIGLSPSTMKCGEEGGVDESARPQHRS